jgi:Fe2+ transport system protein B
MYQIIWGLVGFVLVMFVSNALFISWKKRKVQELLSGFLEIHRQQIKDSLENGGSKIVVSSGKKRQPITSEEERIQRKRQYQKRWYAKNKRKIARAALKEVN